MSIVAALRSYLQGRGLDQAVAELVARAASVRGLADRFASAGVDPTEVNSVADLRALPVLAKDEVMALQHQDPPFGGLLAEDADVVRVFQSPGPLYEPQRAGADSWRWGQALNDLGVGPTDLVLNCFGYHLSRPIPDCPAT